MLQNFPGTVRSYLAILYISKGIALLIPMNLCVFVGEKVREFEKAFLINLVFLLIPAVAYRFGIHGFGFITPISFLADGNILQHRAHIIVSFTLWLASSIFVLYIAKQGWLSANLKRTNSK